GSAHGVTLDVANHHRARRGLGANGETNHRGAAMSLEHPRHIQRLHLDGQRLHVVSSEVGGENTFAAEVANGLAGDGPVLGLERYLIGHVQSSFMYHRSHCANIVGRRMPISGIWSGRFAGTREERNYG